MLESSIVSATALKLFEDKGFKVRVILRDGEPWFVAKDVCDCLSISNVTQACQNLDDDEKGICKVETLGGKQDMMLVSESGLYTLLMRSNKDEAKPFRKWVTNEILPSIRKTGGYNVAQPPKPSYMLESEEERAIAWAEEHRQARLALEAKEREIKSLQAQKDVLRQDYMPLKGFCNGLVAKGLAMQANGKPYAISTLKTKLSPVLQTVSARFGYSVSEEIVVVEGVERKTPYYHKDVCNMVEAVVTPHWLRCPDVSVITDETA